jgi:hypothetical protein
MIILIIVLGTMAFGQNLTQTVRGTIVDADSKLPLIGASVIVLNTNPVIGTSTDLNGAFRLEGIAVGRINLQLSYLGYETKTLTSIVVNSGKEVVLNLDMIESIEMMDEVVVTAYQNKGEAINDMSILSARSISVEETGRYAGSFNDPSRIVSSFAGVTATQDGSNDIIVRGNSPKYIQWRLEGSEITNPNHFNDQNGLSGGISALNNNLLATSDFYTGAFSAEYGDVLSGVYDVKLRAGNNEKFESIFGFGILGTDFTVEGPFKKGYAGSYLVNYRYSTVAMIDKLGLVDIGGVPKFQDMTFKVVLPTKKMGSFSIYGLGGISSLFLEDIQPDIWRTPGDNGLKADVVEDFDKNTFLLNSGITHTLSLNEKSYLKTTVSYASEGIEDDIFQWKVVEADNGQGGTFLDTTDRTLNYTSRLRKTTYRGTVKYSNKINAKNKIQIGSKYSLFVLDNDQSRLRDDLSERISLVDFNENITTLNNYISWKHRLNEDVSVIAGIHNMHVFLNDKSTLEPRIALNWKLNDNSSIHAGYGSHSKMENIHNYFTKIEQEDGSFIEPNKDLGLLKAHHFVLGYQKRFSKNMMAKVEVYYQDLYNLPVENLDTSYYATINEGLEYRFVDLVNEGTGKNYGVELTVERFFANNYYFLINTSIYDSKYKSLEGRERNTRYNGNYLVNFLAGKEYENLGKKGNRTLSLNGKVFFGGGQKQIPLLRDADGNLAVDPETGKFWDYDKAYEDKIEDTYMITLSASYKFNNPNATHEIFINLDNITDNKGKIAEFYDENEPDNIGYSTQFGFFPNLMYRVYF